MDFKPFSKPKKKEVTNPHVKATRKKVAKKSKAKHKEYPKTPSQSYNRTSNGLSTSISEKYEGQVEGIIAFINTLPPMLQHFITNNKVLKTVSRQGYTMFVLEGKVTIKIEEVKFNLKNKLKVTIKEGKKHIVNRYI